MCVCSLVWCSRAREVNEVSNKARKLWSCWRWKTLHHTFHVYEANTEKNDGIQKRVQPRTVYRDARFLRHRSTIHQYIWYLVPHSRYLSNGDSQDGWKSPHQCLVCTKVPVFFSSHSPIKLSNILLISAQKQVHGTSKWSGKCMIGKDESCSPPLLFLTQNKNKRSIYWVHLQMLWF